MGIRNKILDGIFTLLGKTTLPLSSGRILIVRLDAIGDYVLFRNCLRHIKSNGRFKDKKIVLLGNKAFQSIAEKLDSDIVDEFIWIDPQVLNGGFKGKIDLSRKLIPKAFDAVISPVHSRIPAIDAFIPYTGAKYKIGSKGDNANYTMQNKQDTGINYYDELIEVEDISTFEFYRNKTFTYKLTGVDTGALKLEIGDKHFSSLDQENETGEKVVVLFPGAGAEFRRWSTENFAALITSVYDEIDNVRFIIAGGPSDNNLASEIISRISPEICVDNTAAKTSLLELTSIIRSADLLVSNETSAVHFAVAVGTPVVCISNGNHFGRFNPYPSDLGRVVTVYPDEKFNNPLYFTEMVEMCKVASPIDINLIKVEAVKNAALNFLKKEHRINKQIRG